LLITETSPFSSLNPQSETNVVTVLDNVVYDNNFSDPAFCLCTPSSSPSFQHNNNIKSDLFKQDSSKVKRLASNVITSLQKNVCSVESGIDVLRDKIDNEFEKLHKLINW
jgi:hypothetical protein